MVKPHIIKKIDKCYKRLLVRYYRWYYKHLFMFMCISFLAVVAVIKVATIDPLLKYIQHYQSIYFALFMTILLGTILLLAYFHLEYLPKLYKESEKEEKKDEKD